jgi:gliding motility-associated-like protein
VYISNAVKYLSSLFFSDVNCNVKRITFFILLFGFISHAQVMVQPANVSTIQKMIRSIVGDGVKISNIRYSDSLNAFGSFTDITGSIGLKKGFILTSGDAINAIGPNDAEIISKVNNLPGDSDLKNLYVISDGNQTDNIDAAFIEFDMMPQIDTIRIKYVFGSEEYNIQVQQLSDLMGIFLSVSGVNGYRNISTLPGTNVFISVKNINGGPASHCITPPFGSSGVNFNYYIFNPCNSLGTQYNGYTVSLETKVPVIPCRTYKMKIAIADFSDGLADSGTLIEKGSLGKPLILANNKDADTLIELCQSSNKPILKASKNGSTYQWYLNDQPTTITSQSLTIAGYGEYKVVTTVSPGCLWTDSVRVTVGNDFLVNITPHDTLLCAYGTVKLDVKSSIPDSVYSYFWEGDTPLSNDTIKSPTVMPSVTSNYWVKLKNRQGCAVSDTGRVRINKVFYALNTTSLSPVVCKENEATLYSGYVDTQCSSYHVSTVNFNFLQPATSTGIALSYSSMKNDVPIGFDFKFYCNTYNSLNVSSSAYVQFARTLTGAISEIPSTADPNNMIAIAFDYLDPGNDPNRIKYATIGNAPSRIFILTYDVASLINTTDSVTAQLKLFEGGNAIEIHTYKIKNQEPVFITQGIENSDGSKGVPVPGRDYSPFEASLEAWRFELEDENVTKTWYDLSGNVLSHSDTLKKTLSTSNGFVFKTTASSGCKLSDTVNVSVITKKFTALPDTTICFGEKVNLRASGADHYLWNGISTLSGFVERPPISTIYSVTGFFNYPPGCTVRNKVSVKVNNLPFIIRTPDTAVCVGTIVKLLANGGVVTWKDTIAATSFIPKGSKTFPFKITDLNNCVRGDSIRLTVNTLPSLIVSNDTTICFGDYAKLKASGGNNYVWSPSDGLDKVNEPLVSSSPSKSTKYIIKTLNLAGCSTHDSLNVFVHKIQVDNFISASSPSICDLNNATAVLSGPEGYSYLWFPTNDKTQNIKTALEGTYILKITDQLQCSTNDTINIVYDCYGIYIVPNVFTPNNDGANEKFEIKGLDANSVLRIFNRFGTPVYETPNYDNNWAAENFSDGIYYYTIEMGRSKQNLKGWVQVVR